MDIELRWKYWYAVWEDLEPEAFERWLNCQWLEIVSHYEEG